MPVKCLKFKEVNKGCLVGYADLLLEKTDLSLEVRGCMLMQKNNQKWLSLPSKEFKDEKTNETKYYPIVRFTDKDVDKKFQDQAIAVINEFRQASEQPEQKNYSHNENLPF